MIIVLQNSHIKAEPRNMNNSISNITPQNLIDRIFYKLREFSLYAPYPFDIPLCIHVLNRCSSQSDTLNKLGH